MFLMVPIKGIRHKLSRIFILIISILLVFVGCSSYDNTIAQKEKANKNKDIKTYKVGDSFMFGDLEYTVSGFEVKKEYNGHRTENKFVIVTVKVKNNGKEPVTVTGGYFVLVDKDNRVYEGDPTRDISFRDKEYFSLTESINPGIVKKGRVSFEIPENVNVFMLAIRNNMFDFGGAEYRYVALNNNSAN